VADFDVPLTKSLGEIAAPDFGGGWHLNAGSAY
jgi:hypothetical protein